MSVVAPQNGLALLKSTPSYPDRSEQSSDGQRERRPASHGTLVDYPESLIPKPKASDVAIYHSRTAKANYGYSDAKQKPCPPSQVIGGVIAAVNSSLTNVPIDPTLRNAELFHCFHQKVISSMTSIDGSYTPHMFLQEILPWMLQSHIMPHIAILMASAEQSAENANDGKRKSEMIVVKSKVLGLFNEFLDNDFSLVGNAAIRAIFPLVTTELLWGDIENLWAHMKGLKQMVNMKGGLAALSDPVLQQALIVTDYQLACYLEQNVFLQTTNEATYRTVKVSPFHNPLLCSPLADHPKHFSDITSELGLDDLAAKILDDIRFLTLSLLDAENSAEQLTKIRATAAWLYKRLDSLETPPLTTPSQPSNAVTHIVHLVAKVYTSSVKDMTPLSASFPSSMHEQFHSILALIPESLWKDFPGVWYWILLVACPAGEMMRNTTPVSVERARWMRRKMAVAGMAIALEDFGLGTLMVQRFWLVQRWIGDGQRWIGDEKERKAGSIDLDENLSSFQ
ncbi:hypothetical protein DL98DRAFT_584330 [Cadophora sp. DSE1049]|nr:hypothetical protein DL98DRAFT_584330 [Cadophora sp. DSE1049]